MVALHKYLIPLKTKSLLKKHDPGRRSMNYQQAKKIGLLFCMHSFYAFESIRSFENKLKKDGKEVVVLSYLPSNVENFDFHYDFFTQKDFSLFGGIKALNIEKFLQQPLDLLICLDPAPNIYIEFLLAASNARFRIGPYRPEQEQLFELMIKVKEQSDVAELINQIYHYTNEL